ncbi:hypothetical protein PGB90_004929 [Kerria lacca]
MKHYMRDKHDRSTDASTRILEHEKTRENHLNWTSASLEPPIFLETEGDFNTPTHKLLLKNYSKLQMAICTYRNGDYGLNECAKIYGIPTLIQHAKGKNSYHNEHILELEKCFFGLTITDVRRLAFDAAEELRINHRFNRKTKMAGKKLFYGFIKRNLHISICQPELTSMARVQGFFEENIDGFFDILEKFVDKHQFTGETIYNVDKSRFSTAQKKLDKVVIFKSKSQVGGITSGACEKSWIKCQKCSKWAHTACAGVEPQKKVYL